MQAPYISCCLVLSTVTLAAAAVCQRAGVIIDTQTDRQTDRDRETYDGCRRYIIASIDLG